MRKLESQEIERLAMLYTELNSRPGDFAEQLYERYTSAVETINKLESEAAQKNIARSDWGL